jgi:hypothetical protein
LIADRDLAVTIRDILDTCKRFAGLIERWRGSEPASADDFQAAGAERTAAVKDINEVGLLHISSWTGHSRVLTAR